MGLVFELFIAQVDPGANPVSATVFPDIIRDQVGYLQIQFNGSPTTPYTITLYGQADPNAPFTRIMAFSDSVMNSFDNESVSPATPTWLSRAIPLFPAMRVDLNHPAGNGNFDVYLLT